MTEPERAQWVTVATYASGLESDIARSALEGEGIPVLVLSNNAGIFGLAFQGNVAGGIELQVPSPEVERARDILGDPLDGDDLHALGSEQPEPLPDA